MGAPAKIGHQLFDRRRISLEGRYRGEFNRYERTSIRDAWRAIEVSIWREVTGVRVGKFTCW